MTPALAKELVEALEEMLATHPAAYRAPSPIDNRTDNAVSKARAVLARAKAETGTHEYVVTDDGHGRAMVGGRRLATGGCGMSTGAAHSPSREPGPVGSWLPVGARVRVELREGVDFATLLEVL